MVFVSKFCPKQNERKKEIERERERENESTKKFQRNFRGKFVSNSFSFLLHLQTQWNCHSFTPSEVEVHLLPKAPNIVNAQLICMKCCGDKMYYDEISLPNPSCKYFCQMTSKFQILRLLPKNNEINFIMIYNAILIITFLSYFVLFKSLNP